jgi:gp178
MKKQKLIEKIEALPAEDYKYKPYVDKKVVLGLVRQLDEPQKVKIPQFVVDWYEENKDDFEGNLFRCIYEIYKKRNDNELTKFEEWIIDGKTKPFKTLVNMHQFGYEVEKESHYVIKLKGVPKEASFLKYASIIQEWYFGAEEYSSDREIKHTRKELEEAGFGWVFDCEGIQIEEVE